VANVEWNAAVTPDTIFQSGSVGKQFTATAVMMLVEEAKVGLDDPIKKYFPDAPETWNDIKVHNLLSHTSGLSEYETGARTKAGGPFYVRLDYTEDELYKKITEMPMDFKVEDLQKWDGALYTERLLTKASLERMWTVEKLNNGKPNKANYGFAWEIDSANGHRVIAHGGAWQGFTCYIARYVDDRLTVVALTNLDSGHSNPKKIVTGVATIYNPALKPAEGKPIRDKERS